MKYKNHDFRVILQQYNYAYPGYNYTLGTQSLYCITLKVPDADSLQQCHAYMYVEYKTARGGSFNELCYSDFLKAKVKGTVKGTGDYKIDYRHFNEWVWKTKCKGSSNGLTLDLLDSSHIKRAYLYTNYAQSGGGLGGSCMRHKHMQKSLNFYERCGCKILVMQDSNKRIWARALVWENVHSITKKEKETCTYMDRIYSVSSRYNSQMNELARKNKWASYDGESFGGCRTSNLYITGIDMKNITHIPYADSFRRLWFKEEGGGILTCGCEPKCIKHKKDVVTLTHTQENGYCRALDENSVREQFTDCWRSKKDCIFVKQYNGYVAKKNVVKIDGAYFSRHDDVITETVLDGLILKEDMVIEAVSSQSMDKTKGTSLPRYKDKYVHKKNMVTIKGMKYHKKDPEIVNFEKKWYNIEGCYRTKVGALVPKPRCLIMYALREGGKYYTQGIKLVHEKSKINDLKYLAKRDKGKMLWIPEFRIDTFKDYVKMNSGELVVADTESRSFIKKRNKVYYLTKEYPIEPKKYWYPKGKKKVLIQDNLLFKEEVKANVTEDK